MLTRCKNTIDVVTCFARVRWLPIGQFWQIHGCRRPRTGGSGCCIRCTRPVRARARARVRLADDTRVSGERQSQQCDQ